ncbi:neuraminidase-like domain-containing protein, partial [Candidatus Frankia alpina]
MRAHFTQDDWEKAVRPLYDELRDHQRQALIGYLLARPELRQWGVTDADGLFEFFLIDPQMGVCRDTSRIKQAISSVQTFVQRCLLGLEAPGVPTDLLDRDRWNWMQKWVLWEANREVFTTPWRWAREDLRDDQSPFFRELSAKLLQKDISPDTVTEAVRAYVVSVDQVANLETTGLFDDAANHCLYVFARTRTAPALHWFRRYRYDSGYWFPWERVEVDIPSYDVETDSKITGNGSYLIPTVVQGRLVVLWPIFAKKSIPATLDDKHTFENYGKSAKPSDARAKDYWEIKLAFSEYRNGKWSQKQVTTGVLTVEELGRIGPVDPQNPLGYLGDFLPDIDRFQFAPRLADADPRLLIDVRVYARVVGTTDSPAAVGTFAFDGSHLYVASTAAASVPNSGVSETTFHYESATDTQAHLLRLHSLQVLPEQTSAWLADEAPYFEETADGRVDFQPANGSLVAAYHPFAHELLGQLSSGKLRDLYDFYLKNLDQPKRDLAFGRSADGGTYHELRTPYAIYGWEMCFHAPMLLADRLVAAKQFDQALDVLHTVVNPFAKGTADAGASFWEA